MSDASGGRGKTQSGLKSALVGSEKRLSGRGSSTRSQIGNVGLGRGRGSEAMLSMWWGGAAPGAGEAEGSFLCHWVGDCVAAGKWVAPWTGGWEAGWESGCSWVGGWLATCYAKGISEAGMFDKQVDRWLASISSDVLKAPGIQCAAERHTALIWRGSTSRGEIIEAP